jgi:hypothetical protein
MSGSWVNPFGEEALNNLIFFAFDLNATLSCESVGSRCSFLRDEYTEIDEDGGAIADQLGGAVWTVCKCCVPQSPNLVEPLLATRLLTSPSTRTTHSRPVGRRLEPSSLQKQPLHPGLFQ